MPFSGANRLPRHHPSGGQAKTPPTTTYCICRVYDHNMLWLGKSLPAFYRASIIAENNVPNHCLLGC